MTNMWEGLGPDDTPTAPHVAAGAGDGGPWAGGGSSADDGGSSAGGGGSSAGGGGRSGGARGRRWTAGLLIAAAAAGGGAFAVAEASGVPAASTPISLSASSASPASSTSSASQDAAIQVAALSAALRGRGGRGGLARLRRLGGMYGQFTAETKKGARTLAFERGTITSAARGAVTVRAHDGTTWVWDLTGTSVVRDDGKAATASALSAGELVFVGGPVAGGTRDARLIVIRKAASGAA